MDSWRTVPGGWGHFVCPPVFFAQLSMSSNGFLCISHSQSHWISVRSGQSSLGALQALTTRRPWYRLDWVGGGVIISCVEVGGPTMPFFLFLSLTSFFSKGPFSGKKTITEVTSLHSFCLYSKPPAIYTTADLIGNQTRNLSMFNHHAATALVVANVVLVFRVLCSFSNILLLLAGWLL